jgi:hypothetical protein
MDQAYYLIMQIINPIIQTIDATLLFTEQTIRTIPEMYNNILGLFHIKPGALTGSGITKTVSDFSANTLKIIRKETTSRNPNSYPTTRELEKLADQYLR